MNDSENEIGWMVSFGLPSFTRLTDSPPKFGKVEILRRTAKRCVLTRGVECSGYRTHVDAEYVFPTFEKAVESVRDRCLSQARMLRELADKFEKAIGLGEEP